MSQTPQRIDPQKPLDGATNQLVARFSRLYAEAGPEDQCALRVWMRDIILGRKEGSVNMPPGEAESKNGWSRRVNAACWSSRRLDEREVAKQLKREGWYAWASNHDGIVLRIKRVRAKAGRLRSEKNDFDFAVRFLGAFLQQLRQSQRATRDPWKKNARCAGSLMIIISGRSLCWLSRPALFCWSAWVATKALFVLSSRVSDPLKADWQRHVLASSGYLELGMLDDAALALEEIEPEDKTRTEVLGARVALYITAKKWDMAAAVASHLVKVEPENEAWWINLAYSVRRSEGIEQAEAILLRAQAIHPKVAMIAFNLACYASVTGRMEEAKERLRNAIELDKDIRGLALDDEDLKPLWDWIAGLE